MNNVFTEKGLQQLALACHKWNEKGVKLALGYTLDGEKRIAIVSPTDLFQLAVSRPEDANHLFREKADGVHLYHIEINSKKCKTFAFRRLLAIAEKTMTVGDWNGWQECEKALARNWHAKHSGNDHGHIADIIYHGKWFEVKSDEGLLWESWMNEETKPPGTAGRKRPADSKQQKQQKKTGEKNMTQLISINNENRTALVRISVTYTVSVPYDSAIKALSTLENGQIVRYAENGKFSYAILEK